MSTGNYDYDNFVRVDCALPPSEFWINAVHETAHFTMIKRSTFGLFCFFLSQDTSDARSPLVQSLQRLEQAFECVNECYARTKELLLCTEFPSVTRRKQENILNEQRSRPYYARYHMERLQPLLLQYKKTSLSPVFPDDLFLMSANVDMAPLLEIDLTNAEKVQSLIFEQPERLYPDHRLQLLLQSYMRLAQRLPAKKITAELLSEKSGLPFMPQTAEAMREFFLKMEQAFSFRPPLKELIQRNIERLSLNDFPLLTEENLVLSFQLSLSDCVIPSTLHHRFRTLQTEPPVFRPEKNVLTIFLEPEKMLGPAQLQKEPLPIGPRSAFLHFTDTKNGTDFSSAFAADLAEFRALLDLYPGVVYLYLDDYSRYHAAGGFRSMPIFFRADIPWNGLEAELSAQGTAVRRFFLQKYSDSVFFFFGFDPLGNVIFSLFAHWELKKIFIDLQRGALIRCGESDADCYGIHGWNTFRDLIAAVTEDIDYGRLDRTSFDKLRIL